MPTPVPTPVPSPTPAFYGNAVADIAIAGYRVGDLILMRNVQIVLGAGVLVLIILIVLIIVLATRKKKNPESESTYETSVNSQHTFEPGKVLPVAPQPAPVSEHDEEETLPMYDDGEETVNPYGDSEETINPYGSEETLPPEWEKKQVIRFEITGPEEREEEVSFTERMEIGRDAGCDLSLSPKFVSRHHIEIVEMPDGLFMRNMTAERSQRYTLLNHAELGDELVQIHTGDVLEIAQVRVTITIVGE